DDVGRDVGRDVAGLCFDERDRGERTPAFRVRELRRALEQTRVQVEDVAGIRLPPRRSPQEERDLAVRGGVLREVVVDRQRVLLVVEEELPHRATRVGSDELNGCWIR